MKMINNDNQYAVGRAHTCPALFDTANLFLATKMALCPLPFFPSAEESLTSPAVCDGNAVSSNKPLSEVIVTITARSAGLKLRVRGGTYGLPNLRTLKRPMSDPLLKS